MEPAELMERLSEWALYVDAGQQAPLGDWRIWLFLGGRGAGKTRAGAEWIRERISAGARRIALIGPTFNDVREVMIEGPSGLKSIGPRRDRPVYESSRKRLVFPGGAVAYAFSSEDPDGLRGPQFDAAWGDEFAAWAHPQRTLDTLAMGLRLGADPRLVLTTTPRPISALRRLVGQAGVALTRRTMAENARNLAPGFSAAMAAAYGGSALGRQELEGALIEDPPGALWRRDQVEAALGGPAPEALDRIVVAVDPPATSGPRSDECGIIIAGALGSGADRRAVVLADRSFGPAAPAAWAEIAARAYAEFEADAVIAEANQGGEMVREVLRAANADLPVRLVRASRGKRARAEPVAALYAASRVRHAARFPALEDQMCAFGAPDGPRSSPDRVDALVWAIAALMLHTPAAPRLRRL
jgi:phage terminase large subunit-like protein